MNQRRPPRFYFALPRLLGKMRGGDASRAEQNRVEAWVANLAIYAISYLYFAGFVPDVFNLWVLAPIFIILAFLVWLFWLLVLYLDSLILKLLQSLGLFRSLPTRRSQAVLIAALTTLMAVALVQRNSAAKEFAAMWLIAVAMNLAASVVLAFGNGDPARQ